MLAVSAADDRYIASVRPELRRTPAARESIGYLLDLPGLDEDIADLWGDIRDAAVAALPDWAREMYGYGAPPLTPERRKEIRQVLGVLDAVFLGEPITKILPDGGKIAVFVGTLSADNASQRLAGIEAAIKDHKIDIVDNR